MTICRLAFWSRVFGTDTATSHPLDHGLISLVVETRTATERERYVLGI